VELDFGRFNGPSSSCCKYGCRCGEAIRCSCSQRSGFGGDGEGSIFVFGSSNAGRLVMSLVIGNSGLRLSSTTGCGRLVALHVTSGFGVRLSWTTGCGGPVALHLVSGFPLRLSSTTGCGGPVGLHHTSGFVRLSSTTGCGGLAALHFTSDSGLWLSWTTGCGGLAALHLANGFGLRLSSEVVMSKTSHASTLQASVDWKARSCLSATTGCGRSKGSPVAGDLIRVNLPCSNSMKRGPSRHCSSQQEPRPGSVATPASPSR